VGQADLPIANAEAHAKAFCRRGWEIQPRRGKGSHLILTKRGHPAVISLPAGHGTVKRGLLMRAIKDAGLSVEEYLKAFNNRR